MSTTHKNFLFEIGTEELPPQQIRALASSLAAHVEAGLKEHALTYQLIKTYATPRRIAILVADLVVQQPNQTVTLRGPLKDMTTAAEKFAKTCGTTIDQLSLVEEKKGTFYVYKNTRPGKSTAALLPEIITASIKKLSLSRGMRWGNNTISFVRPVHWIAMLLGTEIIHTEVLGIKTSNHTFGHRFHHPKAITISEAGQYETLLATKGFVIADIDKRQQKIRTQLAAITENGTTIISENLLTEVTNLVEWPVALLGSFDQQFLELPRELLITLMEKQQRYFPIIDPTNKLLSQFVIISNIKSKNPGRVIAGNERVIHARFTDAEYFFHNDLRYDLAHYGDQLKSVVFQAELGSLCDKTLRLKTLAGFIATKINANIEHAQRAAALSKCDLVTSMVKEFPELQGIMGDYYARRGEPPAVAVALTEQYLPRFAQDATPATEVGCVLALADRIDNLIGLFGINKIPSGEKDPFGLRRAAMGIVRIILEKKLNLDLKELLEQSWKTYTIHLVNKEAVAQVLYFIYERLRYLYAEQSKDPVIFRAVVARTPTNLLDFEKRFAAVTAFNSLPEAADLIEIYKRIKNILGKANTEKDCAEIKFNKELTIETAERDLAAAIEKNADLIHTLYQNKQYLKILETLIRIKPRLSRFFDEVMVMTEDKKLRYNRLALLKKLQNLFTQVADWES